MSTLHLRAGLAECQTHTHTQFLERNKCRGFSHLLRYTEVVLAFLQSNACILKNINSPHLAGGAVQDKLNGTNDAPRHVLHVHLQVWRISGKVWWAGTSPTWNWTWCHRHVESWNRHLEAERSQGRLFISLPLALSLFAPASRSTTHAGRATQRRSCKGREEEQGTNLPRTSPGPAMPAYCFGNWNGRTLGRWKCYIPYRVLAHTKTRRAQGILRQSLTTALIDRWSSMLAHAAMHVFAASLLDQHLSGCHKIKDNAPSISETPAKPRAAHTCRRLAPSPMRIAHPGAGVRMVYMDANMGPCYY